MEASAAGWSGRSWGWDGFGIRQDLKGGHSLSPPSLTDPQEACRVLGHRDRQVSASTCWQLLPWGVVEKCTKITQSAFLERETGAKAVSWQYSPHTQVQLSRSNLNICSNLQP